MELSINGRQDRSRHVTFKLYDARQFSQTFTADTRRGFLNVMV